jgi:hypothetical protein
MKQSYLPRAPPILSIDRNARGRRRGMRGSRVFVAEGATRARWVELFQAIVIKEPHLVHAAHLRARQHDAALIPERLEDAAALGVAAVLRARVPFRRAIAAPGVAAGHALGRGRDLLEVLEHGHDRADAEVDLLRPDSKGWKPARSGGASMRFRGAHVESTHAAVVLRAEREGVGNSRPAARMVVALGIRGRQHAGGGEGHAHHERALKSSGVVCFAPLATIAPTLPQQGQIH